MSARDELEKKISELPKEMQDIINSCCKQREDVLDKTQGIVTRLKTMRLQIETGVFPNPEINESAKRGARRVVDLLGDTEALIQELVTAMAQADAIASAYIEAMTDSSNLQ
jgi:hypothetical protein